MGSLEDRKIGRLNIRIRILLVFTVAFCQLAFPLPESGLSFSRTASDRKNESRKNKNPSKIELAALRHPALRKV